MKKGIIKNNSLKEHIDLLLSLVILLVLLIMEYGLQIEVPVYVLLPINLLAYLLAGHSVLRLAIRKSSRGDFFNEFVLMSIATIGAFIIGEYEEGVAVMVFYQIGEWFQDIAVNNAKRSIKALLDIRPDIVTIIKDGNDIKIPPSEVEVGQVIKVKPGEKIALDGKLLSDAATFNTSALTGESVPETKQMGDKVFAGMISVNSSIEVKVTALFKDSKLSRILEMVQDATARKSQTQLFISRFAKVYTPIVFFLALAVCLVPYFIVDEYVFQTWFYRALVFLVISCPCALVVSIPLGYFGGIGLASRSGILFKGGNFLDVMTQVNTIVMDKTGTLTKGVFKVQNVKANNINESELVMITAALEQHSTHPIAQAVIEYSDGSHKRLQVSGVKEIHGHGLAGIVDSKDVLAGNTKLLKKYKVDYPQSLNEITDTIVVVSIDNEYAGYMLVADEIKEDAKQSIDLLHQMNIRIVMLSGDKQAVVDQVADKLQIDEAFGTLLPEDKVEKVQEYKNKGLRIAFAGDGINDAPVIALADAGIAMGGLGSDAAIETADIVIQNDQPSKIPAAIRIGKLTKRVVWQNIILAMVVKVTVLILGAGGIATLWEAVIADVGVALLAILNAIRIQRMKL
ncbi:MAG: cadmium-translocating P-type ATPase [Chitinophagales bacterium]|nr:cadmium-translocating P-type ATPase [Chitinophagaceae bacterium]MCB9064689.1 cadmium-translocating P-type ATPase [Chitinophagales bacterium]